VCISQPPTSAGEALAAVRAGLAYLNGMDAADLPSPAQADCLRELAKAEAACTAAHARVLAAFTASGGHEDDGQHTARAWLKWQTQITSGAAAGAVGWTGGWPPTRRSAPPWPTGPSRRRGPGPSPAGPTCSPAVGAPARMRSCWPPRAAALP
jgi:hypothetical protein